MNKPHSFSDPPPSTVQPPGYCIFTEPTPVETRKGLAEPYASISASALLTQDVSHSGWIRKEGCSVRTWKSRFMVLHHGCIYYFKDTNSRTPKGKVALNGYRCEFAPERETIDRYPYTFKLVHGDNVNRTYYFSSPSKSEMEGWIKQINVDIRTYCLGAMNPDEMYDYVDTGEHGESKCPTVPKSAPPVPPSRYVPKGSSQDEPRLSQSLPKGTHMLANTLKASTFPKGATLPSFGGSHTFPKGQSNGGHAPKPKLLPKPPTLTEDDDDSDVPDSDYEDVDDLSVDGVPIRTRPVPPVRPSKKPGIPFASTRIENHGHDPAQNDGDEELYLDLNNEGDSEHAGLPRSPDIGSPRKRPVPPKRPSADQLHSSPSLSPEETNPELIYLPVIATEEDKKLCEEYNKNRIHKQPPKPKPPVVQRPTTQPPSQPATHHGPPPPVPKKPTEEKDFDYLPDACFKPDFNKSQAKVLLELSRQIGAYIIHASQTSETKMVMSVWMSDGIKHYLIFKREDLYTLDPRLENERFPELRQLVKYYYSNSLPRSSQCLTAPFAL